MRSRLYIVSQVTSKGIYVKVTSMVLTLLFASVLLRLVTVNAGLNSNLLELVLRICSFNLFGSYVLFLLVFGCLLLRGLRYYVFSVCFTLISVRFWLVFVVLFCAELCTFILVEYVLSRLVVLWLFSWF